MSEEQAATIEASEPQVAPDATIIESSETVQGDGSFKTGLSEDFRNDPSLKDIHSLDDLAKSYINAQKTIGADKIVLPGKNATDEQREAFYKAIGRPDAPENYGLAVSEDFPEGLIDSSALDGFAKASHQLGLTTQQASGVLKFYEGIGKEAIEGQAKAQAEATESAVTELKKEFGQAFESKVSVANQALKRLAGDDYPQLQKELQMEGVGSRPALVKVFAKVGEMMGESSLAGEGQAKAGRTPAEASLEISRLMSDPAFVKTYQTKMDPGHKAAVATMRQLFVEQAGADNKIIEGSSESISSA